MRTRYNHCGDMLRDLRKKPKTLRGHSNHGLIFLFSCDNYITAFMWAKSDFDFLGSFSFRPVIFMSCDNPSEF